MLVSGKSRNIVLAKLRNFEEADELAEQAKVAKGEPKESVADEDIIVDEEETKQAASMKVPKVCEY